MVDASVAGFLQRLGATDILLWLLTFAVVYGLLSQIKIPKSKEAQAIIAIVIGFLVLLAAPATLVTFISKLSVGFVMLALGLLVLIIFLEAAGIKHRRPQIDPKTGKAVGQGEEVIFFSKHPYIMGIAILIIGLLMFMGAGGLGALGVTMPAFDVVGTVFIVAIILAILWILSESGKD